MNLLYGVSALPAEHIWTKVKKMIDGYIFIAVWSVILIMLIVELGKVQSRLAEDRINKMFEDLKKQKRDRVTIPRYIDAVALIHEYYKNPTYQNLCKAINETPTADVRENIHGRWVVDEDGNIECSVCGHHGVGDLYCEQCGAQMDEEEVNITEMRVRIENLERE